MAAVDLCRGDQFVVYDDMLPRQKLFVEVTRVAKSGEWADIRVCNCFVMWTKRQPLKDGVLPFAKRQAWGQADLDEQAERWDEA